ncbi:hypothetical protein ACFQ7I_12830 [Streptomyces massasporeus]
MAADLIADAHLAITRKTVTGLADRLPASLPELPEHPDCPRIFASIETSQH